MKPSQLLRAAKPLLGDRLLRGCLAQKSDGMSGGSDAFIADEAVEVRCVYGAVIAAALHNGGGPGDYQEGIRWCNKAAAAAGHKADAVHFNNHVARDVGDTRALLDWAAALAEQDGQ